MPGGGKSICRNNEGKETGKKCEIFSVAKFSRRQFLKRTGLAAAGALMASIATTVACKTSVITMGTTTCSNATTSGPDTSNVSASSSVAPSSNPATSSPTVATSTTPATGTPATSGYSYVSPTVLPPLLPIAGTTCTVAIDRKYSTDNVWVKSLSDNVVVIGITTTMVEIIYNPYNISLPKVGSILAKDDAFGAAEGTKMNADLISPVSGTVIQINDVLDSLSKESLALTPVIQDPYNSGWMLVVQLRNPAELSDLVTPQRYIELVASKY
jgi:glycine cleavage system H protein